MTPCVKCGLELPATREFFYGRGEGGLRRECKALFKAAKNVRADADCDHYREVARRSYRKGREVPLNVTRAAWVSAVRFAGTRRR
jgi:hypothetical protein